IGAHTNPSDFFDGAIDMVCLWKKVLSADEVSFMYRSGNGRAPMGFNRLDLFEEFFDPWKKSYKLFAGNPAPIGEKLQVIQINQSPNQNRQQYAYPKPVLRFGDEAQHEGAGKGLAGVPNG